MYPTTSMFIAVGQLAIVILVLFSYPLQIHPARNCLDKVAYLIVSPEPPKTFGVQDVEDDGEVVDDEFAPAEMSTGKFVSLTALLVVGGFVISYLVDDLRMGKSVMEWGWTISPAALAFSVVVRRLDGLDHYIVHSSGVILLEGNLLPRGNSRAAECLLYSSLEIVRPRASGNFLLPEC